MGRLANKNILITGGNSGIGLAAAQEFDRTLGDRMKDLLTRAADRPAEGRNCRTWHNQTELTVKGIHFIQEDSPEEIGEGIAAFVGSLRSI